MKLVKWQDGVWQYHLAQNEADILVGLLGCVNTKAQSVYN